MEKYEHEGQVFKAMRESRGLTLKQVSEGICSSGNLSKFENDNISIGIVTFYQLIQRLGVTLSEFNHAMNDYELDDFKWFLNEIGEYYDNDNVMALRQITNQLEKEIPSTKKLTYPKLNYLMAKSLLSQIDNETPLTKQDKEDIIGYLLFNNHWGYFELSFFGNTMGVLDVDKLVELTNEMLGRAEYYQAITENKSLTIQILLNAMQKFVAEDECGTAKKISQEIQNLIEEEHVYFKLVHKFTKGMLEFSMDNYEIGLQMMEKAIIILDELEVNNLARRCRKTYNDALEHMKGI